MLRVQGGALKHCKQHGYWLIRTSFCPFRHASERNIGCNSKDTCKRYVRSFMWFCRPTQETSTMVNKYCLASTSLIYSHKGTYFSLTVSSEVTVDEIAQVFRVGYW